MASKNTFSNFVRRLENNKIASVEWTIWYDSDEYNFEEDPVIVEESGDPVQIVEVTGTPGNYQTHVHPAFKDEDNEENGDDDGFTDPGELPDNWRDHLWALADKFDKAGVFRLDVKARTVTQIANAYIPDDDVQIDPIDPVLFKFTLDNGNGSWNGPLHPTWSEKDKDSPYLVQYWTDPNGFTGRKHWDVTPFESSGGKKSDKTKPGWTSWQEYSTTNEAILCAMSWQQNGVQYGSVKYPEPGESPIKGVTAARVMDAWDNEVFVVNTKGIIKDRRGPFKIQMQEYQRAVQPSPKSWISLIKGRPNYHKFPDNFKDEYTSVPDAFRDAREYISLNGAEHFRYHVRIIDKLGHEVQMVYQYNSPDYQLVHKDVKTYHIASKDIPTNGILVELHPADLHALAEQLRVKEQHDWATQHARDLYSDDAYKVSIEVISEYNDQGYDDVINDIEVSDRDGNVLSFDRQKVKDLIADDLVRLVVNYIMCHDGDVHVLHNTHLKATQDDLDNNTDKLDLSKYDPTTNDDFYEYLKDDGLEDYMYDTKNNVDMVGLEGDYIVGEYMPTDDRWASMRVFSLTTKG